MFVSLPYYCLAAFHHVEQSSNNNNNNNNNPVCKAPECQMTSMALNSSKYPMFKS